MTTTAEMVVKILTLGDSGVGKTSLLAKYDAPTSAFVASHHTTVGLDFKTKKIVILGLRVAVQVWDTAGQERFRTITTAYYRGADGIALVYDVTDRRTFENIRAWMREIGTHVDNIHFDSSTARAPGQRHVEVCLMAAKCDAADARAVSYDEGSRLAEEFGIPYAETSARENVNVSPTFDAMAERVVRVRKPALVEGDEAVLARLSAREEACGC
jgi:Ras-related protein Rab-8A